MRRIVRGARIVELAAGHGLLAQILLLLDDSSPEALVVDTSIAPSARKVHHTLARVWPRLASRVSFVTGAIERVNILEGDLIVSCHACGALTDRILDRAIAARACVAVLPCCHAVGRCDAGDLEGWVDAPLAIDIVRAGRLRAQGYRVWTQTIPAAITPKNRLLIGRPHA